MLRYDVYLTADAEHDLSNIFHHIADRESQVEAARFLDRFDKIAVSLGSFPQCGGSFPGELKALRIREYREKDFGPYRVFYRFHERRVYVNMISDSRNSFSAQLACRLRPPFCGQSRLTDTKAPESNPSVGDSRLVINKNSNDIKTYGFSNPDSDRIYLSGWPQEPHVATMYRDGHQCGGCSFYAKFNSDYGLCSHAQSRHYLETVFEHFTCPECIDEGWGPHSFTTSKENHCRCQHSSQSRTDKRHLIAIKPWVAFSAF